MIFSFNVNKNEMAVVFGQIRVRLNVYIAYYRHSVLPNIDRHFVFLHRLASALGLLKLAKRPMTVVRRTTLPA